MGLMDSTMHEAVRTTQIERSPNIISIWQQNMNRSKTCQHDLIFSAALARRGIDIVALQEPAINNFGTTIAAREWIPIYPSTHSTKPNKTRSLFLLRSNILTDQWQQVEFPSGDVTIITICGNWGKLTIYNIYNNCDNNDTLLQLEAFNSAQARTSPPPGNINVGMHPTIWLGNFNRHVTFLP